ncbi:rod shape-determining protein MreC [Sulfurimonas sp.]|uniref:rod shape-determining protein MreC n=1 Tax=Sulfurimonas sp. TaxID=2022749 RepID=UPI00260CB8C6|nr:rod shape-determining protein MreC [Sulfurimonas sp.]
MNKQVFSYFSLIVALFVGAIYYSNTLQPPIISTLNAVKTTYHNTTNYISTTIEKHFFQASQIQELKEQLQTYENSHLQSQQLATELADLYKENNSTLTFNPQVELVRTIAYEQFGNLNRLWIEIPDYNASKIYGLTYKEFVAGIVIPKNGRALALMNNDIQSSYSVNIGENKAPGIAHGNNDENIIVSYISGWISIKKGDEVTTSGLDNIFFKGLKVGKVLSVKTLQGYQNAVVEPYYKSNEPNYFHLIRRVK